MNPIVNIIDQSDGAACGEALQKFFEDEDNAYYFSAMEGYWINVYYEDGNREDILTAFDAGRVTLADLDRFSIDYITRKRKK